MILIRHEQGSSGVYSSPGEDRVVAFEPGRSVFEFVDDPSLPGAVPDALILSDDAGHAGATPDEDAGSWLRSWSQDGWDRFDDAFRRAREHAAGMGAALVIRPSSAGMLSDAVCTRSWCTRGAGREACLLLDPMGWIVPSMMRDLVDHLERIVELGVELIAHGRVWGVMVREPAPESGPVPPGVEASTIEACLEPLTTACAIKVVPDMSAAGGAWREGRGGGDADALR